MDNINKDEQFVLRWVLELSREIEYIGTSTLLNKFKLMLLMTYVDIFSQIWGVFANGSSYREGQKSKFVRWSDEFLFSAENKFYVNHRNDFVLLDSNSLYKLRCSLLHFGGLSILDTSNDRDGTEQISARNPIFISNLSRTEFYENYSHLLSERNALVLCPKILFPAVAYAVGNMFHAIAEIKQTRSDAYVTGIQVLQSKISKEGAFRVFESGVSTEPFH